MEKRSKDSQCPEFNFGKFEKEAIQQLKDGAGLAGKNGVLAPLIKRFLEQALDAELDDHLGYDRNNKANTGNTRNGKSNKIVKSSYGEFKVDTPRDRQSTFSPEILKKRETVIHREIDDKIISMYGKGMSARDISSHIEDLYGVNVSSSLISNITDRIIPEVKEWQSRPLDKIYPIVWMDAIHYKVKNEGRIITKAANVVLGLNQEGQKDILGIYISEAEGANFWLSVLTDLENRGVKDILIACIDNLNGFAEAIESTFKKTEVQLCIVHQIRNSLKYVATKEAKAFLKDLKLVYKAVNKTEAENNLNLLEEAWGKKYPLVLKSWRHNWDRLSQYFKYPEEIRRIIYTTNTVEAYNRQLRKITKTKGSFPSDMAIMKLLYLATQDIKKKWTMPIRDWRKVVSKMAILFEGRIDLGLNL